MIIINDDTIILLSKKEKEYNSILNRKGMFLQLNAKKSLGSYVININIVKTTKPIHELSQLELCNCDKTGAMVHLTSQMGKELTEKYQMNKLQNHIKEIGKFQDCKIDALEDLFRKIENIIK